MEFIEHFVLLIVSSLLPTADEFTVQSKQSTITFSKPCFYFFVYSTQIICNHGCDGKDQRDRGRDGPDSKEQSNVVPFRFVRAEIIFFFCHSWLDCCLPPRLLSKIPIAGTLKAKLAKLRSELFIEQAGGGGAGGPGEGFDVARNGDARVALIGFPSVGKSSLLNEMTSTESEAAGYGML